MTERKHTRGGSWSARDEDIERLLYVTDDSAIAVYLGIDVERVAKVRALAARQRNPKRFLDHRAEPEGTADGRNWEFYARGLAEDASAKLLTAIERTGQKIAPELPKRKLSFEEQLALVASGKVGIVDLGA